MKTEDIGIITPYNAQVQEIKAIFSKDTEIKEYEKIEM
jgi:superfamily I DNA and/or RNA helicase